MTSPCCFVTVHSNCGIKWVLDYNHMSHHVPCVSPACNTILYTTPYENDYDNNTGNTPPEHTAAMQRINELRNQAPFKADLKVFKKSFAQARKGLAAIKRHIGAVGRQFKEEASPHITPLKELQKLHKKQVMNHPLRKDYMKKYAAYIRESEKIKAKYSLNGSAFRYMKGEFLPSSRHFSSIAWMCRRKLRVRLV